MSANYMVEKYLGRPFVEGTFDCFDLVIAWFADLGYKIPNYKHGEYWQGQPVDLGSYFKYWRRLNENEKPRVHDGVFIVADDVHYHMGIYLGDGTFLHCTTQQGVIRTPVKRYRHIIEGYYRLRMTEDGSAH